MPAYAFPNRQSYDKMARVVKLRDGREGGLLPNKIVPTESRFYVGKMQTAVTAGPQTDPKPIFEAWRGPAYGVDDESTGPEIEIDYVVQDFSTTDYVSATRYKGQWYAHCFLPTGA